MILWCIPNQTHSSTCCNIHPTYWTLPKCTSFTKWMSLTTQQSLKHIFGSMHYSYFIFGTQSVHDRVYSCANNKSQLCFVTKIWHLIHDPFSDVHNFGSLACRTITIGMHTHQDIVSKCAKWHYDVMYHYKIVTSSVWWPLKTAEIWLGHQGTLVTVLSPFPS